MDSGTVTRRVAAIAIGDVVGYTRLMERDDTDTFARLGSIRNEVIDPAIISHGGHIVQTAGDGWLAEFPSALAALRASIQIQRDMAKRNAGASPDTRIEYRIGINLGDIMVKGTEIAGDGVNVASRLESIAEPGGLCVSTAVREQVHGQFDAEFVDAGEQHVKNIARPIRVYRLHPALTDLVTKPPVVARIRRWKYGLRYGGAAALLVALAVGLWWMSMIRHPSETATPLPFSIAILPFTPSSTTPADGGLAERLTRDLTTTLGRWRMAQVVSHGQAAAYKGKNTDARVIGRELNVRHLVEGEVGHVGEAIVVTVRDVDTATGTQTWSDRMEFQPALLAAEPDAVLIRTDNRLRSGISRLEQRLAADHPAKQSALNWYLRGAAAGHATDSWLAGAREARRYFDAALQVDPNFVPAIVGKQATLHWEVYEDPIANREQMAAEMESLSNRALGLDAANADAWAARADTLGWLARWEEASAANDKGRAIDPTNFDLWDNGAWLNYAMGKPSESLAIARRIIAIDPPGIGLDWYFMCRGYLMLGQYSEAVPACETASALDRGSWQNQLQLVAAYAQNGDLTKAMIAKAELLKRQPGYTIAKDRGRLFSDHPEFLRQVETHLYPGLRKAGIPEK